MATQTLLPVQLVADGGGLDVTAQLIAATGTTIQFANTGREILFLVVASGSPTVTVNVGALVDGQTVTSFPAVTPTATHLYSFGPFHSVIDISGTNLVQVTLSTITGITLALAQTVGVF